MSSDRFALAETRHPHLCKLADVLLVLVVLAMLGVIVLVAGGGSIDLRPPVETTTSLP